MGQLIHAVCLENGVEVFNGLIPIYIEKHSRTNEIDFITPDGFDTMEYEEADFQEGAFRCEQDGVKYEFRIYASSPEKSTARANTEKQLLTLDQIKALQNGQTVTAVGHKDNNLLFAGPVTLYIQKNGRNEISCLTTQDHEFAEFTMQDFEGGAFWCGGYQLTLYSL
jgi:hypothetical protein